jgi:predicted metal-dependent enzyme (double-stranded beta helix superfamily)
MSKDLTELPGKEVEMITVEYPPGSIDPIHRHNAHAFVYVLEGSIVMQVKGGKEVTLTPGQTFYEGPDDVHLVGGTQALPSLQSSWCCSSKTRALRCWCQCQNESTETALTLSLSRR